ncbi:hypothetical protein EJ08DRAFT_248519 [Tothia fuscella]|uniref:2EXR domain-containing protein n=1 Tax=Tothia fuscella TaxID=1048955 RepID=A0A9P4NRF8_9PEZI|nr:hypothetical protein EJ08DRAFT_248519 [Tothia fuscella]
MTNPSSSEEATKAITEIGFMSLDLEIRLMIWELVYLNEPPRVVEVRTRDQIPTSPSPRPVAMNICYEAREEAQRLARRGGHILFDSSTPRGSVLIILNPEKDTLYLPSETRKPDYRWAEESIPCTLAMVIESFSYARRTTTSSHWSW